MGGVGIHMTKSGVAHLSAENDIECINYIRELISYLPGNNMEEPPFVVTNDSPDPPDTRTVRLGAYQSESAL